MDDARREPREIHLLGALARLESAGMTLKDRNGEPVTKAQARRNAALYRAQSFGGTEADYLNGHGGNSNGYSHGEAPGHVVAEYIYQDKDREPYLKVERTEGKSFPQFHWRPG